MQQRERRPRLHAGSIRRGRVSAILFLFVSLVWTAFGATAALAQTTSADPGLDAVMKTVPSGFTRVVDDPIPTGPMTVEQFNELNGSSLPEREKDHAVFYGATFERPDGSRLLFLGMSTVYRANAKQWAAGAARDTLTDDQPFDVLIPEAMGAEGTINGAPVALIAFARNGRGFAVLTAGETARQDALRFAEVVAGAAQSTPVRADAEPEVSGAAAAIGLLVFLAIVVIAVVVLSRVLRKRSRRRAAQLNASMGPLSNPWGTNTGYPAAYPPPSQTVPPPPPSPPPPPPWAR